MKYGVIVYKETDNIGDDILSYAEERYLPQIDYVLDRENLDTFCPEDEHKVAAIVNGWFLFAKDHWPPSPYITPLFIGIHFTNDASRGIKDSYLDGLGRRYFLEHAPIGCRDVSSLEKMQKRNIPAYFSGCVTMTLSAFENIEKDEKILVVDVPNAVKERMGELFGKENVYEVTHYIPVSERGKSWSQRRITVENILKNYQKAKYVVTTRLHCALPCLALGTNVTLLEENNPDCIERKGTFGIYLDYCSVESFLKRKNLPELDLKKKNMFLEKRNEIISKCKGFIQSCEMNDGDMTLPDYKTFKMYCNEKIEWQRKLVENEILYVNKKQYTELIEAKHWIEQQLDYKNQRILELEQWTKELEKAEAFKDDRIAKMEMWIRKLEKEKG